ncbi:uncharacterized protein F5891DRAFT_1193307 [Suillus fuscotomentosus]|uniref:Uncharacterized protein n=1 Tax=Suillus fuscotomentosus TaxID=1912939 RepID=A0AAD4HH24_9AGAM|nr:uncharacterized protein F5891DRAFT_1193307 [Suillus fuscotomentosus]KAG1896293.1 hypothetical protein F5891DRAFT_1193307 [Suillus fuscotomentosus]
MSQPANTVPKCMNTRAKNATQHPGYILTGGEGHIKRCTKAQKAADDQHEKEAKEASEMAVQEGYKCIAVFQKKMQTDQANTCADAPKPTHPCPRPCPVKKAVKDVETSNLTMAEDKAMDANGKGGTVGGNLAASANVEHPESDAEEEEKKQVPVAHYKNGKKVLPVKMPVRDAIEAVDADILIESTVLVLQDIWECTKDIAAKRRGVALTLDEDSEDERALIFDIWYCPFCCFLASRD